MTIGPAARADEQFDASGHESTVPRPNLGRGTVEYYDVS